MDLWIYWGQLQAGSVGGWWGQWGGSTQLEGGWVGAGGHQEVPKDWGGVGQYWQTRLRFGSLCGNCSQSLFPKQHIHMGSQIWTSINPPPPPILIILIIITIVIVSVKWCKQVGPGTHLSKCTGNQDEARCQHELQQLSCQPLLATCLLPIFMLTTHTKGSGNIWSSHPTASRLTS